MKRALKYLVSALLKKFDLAMISSSRLQYLTELNDDFESLPKIINDNLEQLVNFAEKESKSQLKQDLFVLLQSNFKTNGFFVEFGATNGIDLSNTYILEKEYGWNGILAEPAKCWHTDLRNNRNCHIDTGCVWRDSNSILSFKEVDSAELSTIVSYGSSDNHREKRKVGHTYSVNSISLLDLLEKYDAPLEIDYLSIDTEGSELDILRSFDFDRYQIKLITCEHNFTSMREEIFELLTAKGYMRKFAGLSKWDDWYFKN